MKLTNLETYLFIMEHMDDSFIDMLCNEHEKERISISVLKYLKEQKKILKSWNSTKDTKLTAAKEGVSRDRVYRAIESLRKHKVESTFFY